MALQNQAGMYNGSVALNPLPYVQIAMAARNRKAAREEAIDKYYQKMPDTINDKGLRDQEVPIIEDYKKKIFEYGIKNRDALRKGDGAARLGLDQLMREATSVARLSKNAAQVDLSAGKSLMNKDNQFILNSDDYMAEHEKHLLPVTDPNHKTLDLTKFAANRPFNSDALIKRNADIKYSDGTPEVTDHPTDPLSQVVTTRPVLDEANKKVLYDRAANDLHNNPMFANLIKNKLDKNQLDGILKIAQEQFGVKNPMDISDEDIAAAYEYSLIPVKQTVQKRIANTEAIMDKKRKEGMEDWKTKNAITYAQSLAKIRLNNQNKKEGLPTEDTGYVSDEVAAENGEIVNVATWGSPEDKRTVVYVDKVDPERLDMIIGRDLSKKQLGVSPIDINGKKGYFVDPSSGDWEGAKGQKISREAAKDRYIRNVSPTKFKVQVGTKASENTKGKAPVSKPAAKPKKDPLNLGF